LLETLPYLLASVALSVLALVVVIRICSYEKRVSRRTIVALSVVPLIGLLLVFTNEYLGLIWTNVRLDAVDFMLPLDITYGLGYWVLIVGYSYVLLLLGTIILVRRIVNSRGLYRLQAFPYDPYDHKTSIIVLDSAGRIVDLNPSAKALLGHTLREVVARPIESVWTEWSAVRKALDAETKEVSLESGGKQQFYELQSSALAPRGNNDVMNMLITLRNITDRKIMEEKLRLYSGHLEELVAERTKELREAERMAAIGETAAMVGHDLRNPLQGIAGAVHVLRQKFGSKADSETMEMLTLIKSSIGYADNIVKDLMDYSSEIHLELTESTAKAVTEAALLQVKIPDNVTVRDLTQETPRVIIDVAKMQRVLVNLLRNAIDAMPKGGQITLSSSESKGILEIRVTDTGQGIPDDVMRKLWKPFKTTKSKGTGLGLAICRRIVEAHEGTIQVESTVGKGSTFTITIPINRSPNKPRPILETAAALVDA
jgi:PAS domain S-box-containing protein